MKILFFGDARWGATALRLLIDQGRQVVGVVQRVRPTDDEIEKAAREFGLPLLQPARCNAPEFLEEIRRFQPDLNLSASYDQILRQPIIDSAPLGFVNFHAGKLPFYRGRSVINWAIINGETEIGITAHFVDEGIDTGDIILQRTLPIGWTDGYGDVMDRVTRLFPEVVAETVAMFAEGAVPREAQSHLPGSYFPRRGPGDEWIDWQDSSRNIYNKIRGICRPAPGARTWFAETEIVLWRALYDPDWPEYIATPGQVVGIEPGGGLRVKTGDSTIVLEEWESTGDSPLPRIRIGQRFGINLAQRMVELSTELATLRASKK